MEKVVVVILAQDVVVTPGKSFFFATHSETHSVCFSLVGLGIGHKSGVGDFATPWNVV